ncbi:MAG TPA: ComF family protein [Firmicutes bacterium]|nr:ComF family protein [Bacillota bacterium]
MSMLSFLLDILYPPRCPFCGSLLRADSNESFLKEPTVTTGEDIAGSEDIYSRRVIFKKSTKIICSRCAEELPWIVRGCARCGCPLEEGDYNCTYCSGGAYFSFDDCCALGLYRGEIRRAVHRLKYHGKMSLAVPLGKLLSLKLARMTWISSVECLVPVPLFGERQRWRGYNQASLLAGVIGKELQLPVLEALVRVRDTGSQTGFNRTQRKKNLHGAFDCSQELKRGSHILLIDDVLTSGATAHEASCVLKNGGAGRVSVAVLAR